MLYEHGVQRPLKEAAEASVLVAAAQLNAAAHWKGTSASGGIQIRDDTIKTHSLTFLHDKDLFPGTALAAGYKVCGIHDEHSSSHGTWLGRRHSLEVTVE